MKKKLTLTIDNETKERAKELSAKTGKSISKMVEEYLNSLTDGKEIKEPVVEKLSGMLKNKVSVDTDWKKIKTAYLKKKYGV